MTNVYDLIRPLSITANYKGFRQLIYAVTLALEDSARLEFITVEILMATAWRFGCKWKTVERNIRTVASRAWRVNPSLLCHMAGRTLSRAPSSAELISIIAMYALGDEVGAIDLYPDLIFRDTQ